MYIRVKAMGVNRDFFEPLAQGKHNLFFTTASCWPDRVSLSSCGPSDPRSLAHHRVVLATLDHEPTSCGLSGPRSTPGL